MRAYGTAFGATILVALVLTACGGQGPVAQSNVAGLPTLGELFQMIQNSTAPDSDGDFLPDDIETGVLKTNPADRDTDHDGLPDNYELFGQGLFHEDDYPPDLDQDGLFASRDNDDDDDLVNDGRSIDTDGDGIANYLEYYGYVYDWMTGIFFSCEDIDCKGLTIYKSDPLQVSTDQDAYSDAMEVSGERMDLTVDAPGDHPLVPAYPNLVVELVGYSVTLNEDIEHGRGGSLTKGTEWTEQTERSHSFTAEATWEVGVEVGGEVGTEGAKFTGSVTTSVGLNVSASNTTTHSVSKSTSTESEINWSESRSFNPTDAAHVKLLLKMHNYGTAAASNIVPTLTLKVAGLNVLTFEPGTRINILVPEEVYPAEDGVYWVVDKTAAGDPLSMTMTELRAFESGAPISVVLNQVQADVLLLNEAGLWEEAGDCNEFMARCDAACANLRLDIGEGSFLHALCYASTGPSGPIVTLDDALRLVADVTVDDDGYRITYRDVEGLLRDTSLEDWEFAIDRETWRSNGYDPDDLAGTVPTDFDLGTLVLRPESSIIGKAPRPPEQPKPAVHFAYLSRENRTAAVCATDYRGVDEVIIYVLSDDGSGPPPDEWPMTESGVDSSIYLFSFDDEQWAKVEAILDRRTDPDPSFTDILKAEARSVSGEVGERPFDVIPPNPRPVPPDIDFVSMDIANGSLYAHVIPDDAYPPHWYQSYPVLWVRAFHDAFPGDAIDMEPPPNAFEDVYGYRCDLPPGWKDTNVRIVAFVAPAVWAERFVQTSDVTSAHAQGPMDLKARFTYSPVHAEWAWQGTDLDVPTKKGRGGLFTQPLEFGGAWRAAWNPSAAEAEFYVRYDSAYLSFKEAWFLYFNTLYKPVGKIGETAFEDKDAADVRFELDTGGTSGGEEQLDLESSAEEVFLIETSDGRVGKFMITDVTVWPHWTHFEWYCQVSFRYVVFAEPGPVIAAPSYVLMDGGKTAVVLDGTGSSGASRFLWSVTPLPPLGPADAELDDINSSAAILKPKKSGMYEVTLEINQGASTAKTATKTIEIAFPEAHIAFSPDPADFSGGTVSPLVSLDGTSVGAKSYSWRIKSKPAGSSTNIDEGTKNSRLTSFEPDTGSATTPYVVELTINSGTVDERTAEAEIFVTLPP